MGSVCAGLPQQGLEVAEDGKEAGSGTINPLVGPHTIRDDLLRLGRIAREDRENFFVRLARYRVLADRITAVALCQGAALHFLGGQNGVEDFDAWPLYAAHPGVPCPPRRRAARDDFGHPRFARSPARPGFVGRRVGLLERPPRAAPDADPADALRSYLSEGRTGTARHLATKTVVPIGPAALVKTVVGRPV